MPTERSAAARHPRRFLLTAAVAAALVGATAAAALFPRSSQPRRSVLPLPLTIEEDFFLSGTQVFDIGPYVIQTSDGCVGCHGPFSESDPHTTWRSSKMAYAGRNPLFMAKMTLANQLVENSGHFCLRCHVPMSFITGSALEPWGDTLNHIDMDGVSCHFCHAMVDPIYVEGVSPPEDVDVLAALDAVPQHYGNSMFVLDHNGLRRGPRGVMAVHDSIQSPFHKSGSHCGTCHDVGNVAVSLQKDGTYWFNPIGEPVPDEDLWTQYPLERTYTEWKLSEFAATGVDMQGRFGGDGHPTGIIHTCQDCHMPRTFGSTSPWGQQYPDLAQHHFAGGGGSWGLEMIGLHYQDDPAVDPADIQRGIDNSIDMLQRAASLDLWQDGSTLHVKVINETGHKLPTGHIEGRRVWINVALFDDEDNLIHEYGQYDYDEAILDEESTVVYEMHPGISEQGSKFHGLPAGPSMASVVADIIIKDSRIPPRGFDNAAFAAAGAPVVGHAYADGQHWDEACFAIPANAARVEVAVNYQMMTRAYVESLRDNNYTNDWGDIVYDLWLQTDKAPPIPMVWAELELIAGNPADLNGDGVVDVLDLLILLDAWGVCADCGDCPADLNDDCSVDVLDLLFLLDNWG
jgi:hypothetical protein